MFFSGVSWNGLENIDGAPHGLWARSWQSMLDQMVGLNLNVLRLPFSGSILVGGYMPQNINYYANPDLRVSAAGRAEEMEKSLYSTHLPSHDLCFREDASFSYGSSGLVSWSRLLVSSWQEKGGGLAHTGRSGCCRKVGLVAAHGMEITTRSVYVKATRTGCGS